MSFVVLDTDVSSQVIKNRLPGLLGSKLVGKTWCVTFVTVGELSQWAEVRKWGPRLRGDLERWLGGVMVIDSDDEVCREWGALSAAARLRGMPRPVNDSWIAACCLSHDVPLATLNTKDFVDFVQRDGLRLL